MDRVYRVVLVSDVIKDFPVDDPTLFPVFDAAAVDYTKAQAEMSKTMESRMPPLVARVDLIVDGEVRASI